jgi:hypothetical protein
MASKPFVIHVPKAARSSFNKDRPLAKNLLILNQVKHFRAIEQNLPPDRQTGIDPKSITTEGRAAEYIRAMTTVLHPKVAKSGGQ